MSRKYHVKIVLYWLKLTFFDRRPFDAIGAQLWRQKVGTIPQRYKIGNEKHPDTYRSSQFLCLYSSIFTALLTLKFWDFEKGY
jgi:hypothetical protein